MADDRSRQDTSKENLGNVAAPKAPQLNLRQEDSDGDKSGGSLGGSESSHHMEEEEISSQTYEYSSRQHLEPEVDPKRTQAPLVKTPVKHASLQVDNSVYKDQASSPEQLSKAEIDKMMGQSRTSYSMGNLSSRISGQNNDADNASHNFENEIVEPENPQEDKELALSQREVTPSERIKKDIQQTIRRSFKRQVTQDFRSRKIQPTSKDRKNGKSKNLNNSSNNSNKFNSSNNPNTIPSKSDHVNKMIKLVEQTSLTRQRSESSSPNKSMRAGSHSVQMPPAQQQVSGSDKSKEGQQELERRLQQNYQQLIIKEHTDDISYMELKFTDPLKAKRKKCSCCTISLLRSCCDCFCSCGQAKETSWGLGKMQEVEIKNVVQQGFLTPLRQRDVYDPPGGMLHYKNSDSVYHKYEETLQKIKEKLEDDLFGNSKNENNLKCLIHPKSNFKMTWDMYITLLLLFVSIQTPWQIAFRLNSDEIERGWVLSNYWVDISFLIDIIIVFNSAYVDQQQLKLITERKKISSHYLKTWFTIDVISIIPVDLVLEAGKNSGNENLNSYFKLARVSKLYRLLKLTRMTRMLKILKESSQLMNYFKDILSSNVGIDRLIFFMLLIFIMCHCGACMWVMIAQMQMDSDSNWLTKFGYIDDSDYDLWVTSMYFTVTTITTVGYGDISAQNASERIFGSILKIAGVLIFSVTSGALTSIITNLDAQQAKLKDKLNTLDKLQRQHRFEPKLTNQMREAIKFSHQKNDEDMQKVTRELPPKLQSLVALEIHKATFSRITLFRQSNYPGSFYAWIGSRLKHTLMCETQYIYQEGDKINDIYFINQGLCGFSLPRYYSLYIKIEPGDIFGVIDIVYNDYLKKNQSSRPSDKTDQWSEEEEQEEDITDYLKYTRTFTVQCVKEAQLLKLTMDSLMGMKIEFPEVYADIFKGMRDNLWCTLKLKQRALLVLQDYEVKYNDECRRKKMDGRSVLEKSIELKELTPDHLTPQLPSRPGPDDNSFNSSDLSDQDPIELENVQRQFVKKKRNESDEESGGQWQMAVVEEEDSCDYDDECEDEWEVPAEKIHVNSSHQSEDQSPDSKNQKPGSHLTKSNRTQMEDSLSPLGIHKKNKSLINTVRQASFKLSQQDMSRIPSQSAKSGQTAPMGARRKSITSEGMQGSQFEARQRFGSDVTNQDQAILESISKEIGSERGKSTKLSRSAQKPSAVRRDHD